MRLLIQRVLNAAVEVEACEVARIDHGLLIFVGVGQQDTEQDAEWLAQKVVKLRLFSDDLGKMNRSVVDISGEILSVSQFTLFSDLQKGNRPSFISAAPPDLGKHLWQHFNATLESLLGFKIQKGVFAADMKVSLVGNGPVTLWLDSRTATR